MKKLAVIFPGIGYTAEKPLLYYAAKLFTYLKERQGFHGLGGDSADTKYLERVISEMDPDYENNDNIKWNFTKFLCDRDGNVVARYEPTEDMEALAAQVKSLL